MDRTLLKIVLLFLMILVTVIFGLLPVKVLKILRQRAASREAFLGRTRPALILCLLTCFTGGVFFGTCFLHLLPEATEHMSKIIADNDWDVHYPIAELISCLGFFMIFFIEEIVLLCLRGGRNLGPSITHVHHHFETPSNGTATNSASPPGMVEHAPMQVRSSSLKSTHVEYAVTNNTPRERNGRREGGSESERSKLDSTESSAVCSDRPCCGEILHREVDIQGSGTTEVCHVVHAEPECCEEPCKVGDGCDIPPIKMGYKPHAHHHGVRSVTLVIALSLHSIIEGLAFGIQATNKAVVMLFASIIMHKCIVAFSVGLQLARTHSHQIKWVVISILFLAATAPLGAAIGIGLDQLEPSQGRELLLVALEGLCVGTFIYVTFFEVFAHERDNEHPNLLKLLVILVGFGVIACIRTVGHEHGHELVGNATGALPEHGHDHGHHDHSGHDHDGYHDHDH